MTVGGDLGIVAVSLRSRDHHAAAGVTSKWAARLMCALGVVGGKESI